MKSLVVKRSIVVSGHKTSVSLEDAFWTGIKEIASGRNITLSDLDYRFRESCHKGGIHLSFQAPICAGALRTKD